MLGPAITALQAFIRTAAPAPTVPARWANEMWDDPTRFDDNDNPIDASGDPRSFIEYEVIGGENRIASFRTTGHRMWRHPGLMRAYIAVPSRTGTAEAFTIADAISAALERVVIDISADQRVRMQDASTAQGVAWMDRGNYYVLMVSVAFEFEYSA